MTRLHVLHNSYNTFIYMYTWHEPCGRCTVHVHMMYTVTAIAMCMYIITRITMYTCILAYNNSLLFVYIASMTRTMIQ